MGFAPFLCRFDTDCFDLYLDAADNYGMQNGRE